MFPYTSIARLVRLCGPSLRIWSVDTSASSSASRSASSSACRSTRLLEKAGARVHLADSACLSPDGSGREWKPKLPPLSYRDEAALVPAETEVAA